MSLIGVTGYALSGKLKRMMKDADMKFWVCKDQFFVDWNGKVYSKKIKELNGGNSLTIKKSHIGHRGGAEGLIKFMKDQDGPFGIWQKSVLCSVIGKLDHKTGKCLDEFS